MGANPCNLTTGINQIEASIAHLYPNPTTGVVKIEGVTNEDLTILVHDVYGKLVLEVQNETSLDLSSFVSGMYYLAILQGDAPVINKKVSLIK